MTDSEPTIAVKACEFDCCVCMTPMYPVMQTLCSHAWCSQCDLRLERCPICRADKLKYRRINSFATQLVFNYIGMHCPYGSCDFEGTTQQLKAHKKTCEHRCRTCKYCLVVVPVTEHQKHLSSGCASVPVQCDTCKQNVPRQYMAKHCQRVHSPNQVIDLTQDLASLTFDEHVRKVSIEL